MRENYDIRLVQDGRTVEAISIDRRHRSMLRTCFGGLGLWEVEGLTGRDAAQRVGQALWDLTAPYHAAAYTRLGSPTADADHVEIIESVRRLVAACRRYRGAVIHIS